MLCNKRNAKMGWRTNGNLPTTPLRRRGFENHIHIHEHQASQRKESNPNRIQKNDWLMHIWYRECNLGYLGFARTRAVLVSVLLLSFFSFLFVRAFSFLFDLVIYTCSDSPTRNQKTFGVPGGLPNSLFGFGRDLISNLISDLSYIFSAGKIVVSGKKSNLQHNRSCSCCRTWHSRGGQYSAESMQNSMATTSMEKQASPDLKA